MCIDLNNLNTEILKDSPDDLMFFQDFIDFMIKLKPPVTYKELVIQTITKTMNT